MSEEKYPFVGIHKDNKLIVFFTSNSVGYIIKTNEKQKLFEFKDDWDMDNFKKFDGNIKLEYDGTTNDISIRVTQSIDMVSLVVDVYKTTFNIEKSKSEVRRLIEGGSVSFSGEKIIDPKYILNTHKSGVLKLDKKHAVKLDTSS
jgi:tyrosyl-tRNA synthetase